MEELADMAGRSGALAAINGTYFQAYGGRPDPWNTLISNGKVIHSGSNGTTVGITANGRVKMAAVKIEIEGAINDSHRWPNNWYSYGFNHTPGGAAVYIHTPERGEKIGFNADTSVVIAGGKVVRKTFGTNTMIPRDGFVISFMGQEAELASRFQVGNSVSYRVIFKNTGNEDWRDVVTAVGAGPRLLTNGRITVEPLGEGFTEAKITEASGMRSAIGVRRDGAILLVTVSGATVKQLAAIMQELGAYNAMNLDGGASSGLWFQGRYITQPGRLLSNALLFK